VGITVEVLVSVAAASPLPASEARRVVRAVLRAEHVRRAAISLALVGRRRIRTINRRHLGRDRETDVIAFALSDAPPPRRSDARTGGRTPRRSPGRPGAARAGTVVGDVYVCVPLGLAQARRYGTTPRDELRRLVVHGVLHVLGHDHPAGRDRTAAPMWRLQERLLAGLRGRR
jgi:probable rRNA maturation factor